MQYVLTPAGHELRPVVEALGVWGIRWIGVLGDEDLDPKLLPWDMHSQRRPCRGAARADGGPVQLHRRSREGARLVAVITSSGPGSCDVDLCDDDPGYDVAVSVTASLRRMIEVWRGDLGWGDALRSGEVSVDGPEALRRAVPEWFKSAFAAVPRPS